MGTSFFIRGPTSQLHFKILQTPRPHHSFSPPNGLFSGSYPSYIPPTLESRTWAQPPTPNKTSPHVSPRSKTDTVFTHRSTRWGIHHLGLLGLTCITLSRAESDHLVGVDACPQHPTDLFPAPLTAVRLILGAIPLWTPFNGLFQITSSHPSSAWISVKRLPNKTQLF